MKKRLHFTGRLFAAFMTVAVLSTSLGITGNVFAAEDKATYESFALNQTEADSALLGLGDSLCTGGTFGFRNYKQNGVWKRERARSTQGGDSPDLLYLSDCLYTGSQFMSGYLMAEKQDDNTIKYYNDGTEKYYDIVQDFGRVCTVKTIVVMNHITPYLRTGRYVIYLSKNADDLYNESNRVFEYHRNFDSYLGQKITLKTPTDARYMGMKMLNPYASDDTDALMKNGTTATVGNCYLRLFEFNAFGTEEPNYALRRTSHDTQNYTNNAERNSLIDGLTPSSAFSVINNDPTTKKSLSVSSVKNSATKENITEAKPFASMTDGNADTYVIVKAANNDHSFLKSGASSISYGEDKLYHQFNYALSATANVTGFSFNSPVNYNSTPYIFRFSVANTEAELFGANAFNSKLIYNNSPSVFATITKSGVKGKYFGLRVICPCVPTKNIVCPTISGSVHQYTPSGTEVFGDLRITGTYTTPLSQVSLKNVIIPENGTSSILFSSAKAVYSGIRDSSGKYPTTAKVTVTADSMIKDGGTRYYFVGWSTTTTKSGIITYDISYTTPISVGALYAIYDTATPTKTVMYTFYDREGNIIYKERLPRGFSLSSETYDIINSAVPEIAGYKRKTATVRFGSQLKEMPMWDSDDLYGVEATVDREFRPVYEADDTTYTVTVNGVAAKQGGCRFDERIILAANSKGWNVNGAPWCNKNGGETYVVGDMTFTNADAAVTNEVVLYKNGTNSATFCDGKMTFFAKQSVPSNATVVERGVVVLSGDYIYTSDYKNGTYSRLTVGGSGVLNVKSKTKDSTHFAISLSGVGRKETRVARAYCTYTVGSTRYTKYSNVVTIQMK